MKPAHAFLILFSLAGCTSKVSSSVGVASSGEKIAMPKSSLLADLKQTPGVAVVSVQTSALNSAYEVVTTSRDEKYFMRGDRVVSMSRSPTSEEETLIYWRYQFENAGMQESKVKTHGQAAHEKPLLQLTSDSLGKGVVYNPNREKVERVFFYEAH